MEDEMEGEFSDLEVNLGSLLLLLHSSSCTKFELIFYDDRVPNFLQDINLEEESDDDEEEATEEPQPSKSKAGKKRGKVSIEYELETEPSTSKRAIAS